MNFALAGLREISTFLFDIGILTVQHENTLKHTFFLFALSSEKFKD
jgi:hypothetical protein